MVVYTLSDGVVLFPKWVIPLAKDCHLPDHNGVNGSNSAGLCYQVPPSCVDRHECSTARRKLVFAGGWLAWLAERSTHAFGTRISRDPDLVMFCRSVPKTHPGNLAEDIT